MKVIITGASKGLGKAIAEKFAAANHYLFLCSRNENVLQETQQELLQDGCIPTHPTRSSSTTGTHALIRRTPAWC